MSENARIKLLLISDLHCIGDVWPAFNWITGDTRRTEKALAVFEEALSKYFDEVDYVLIVGDLTDSGKESQYRAVVNALDGYAAEKICMIPGNHDVANFNQMRTWKSKMKAFKKHFRDYLHPDPEQIKSETYFPYVRELNSNFVFIGLDTTLGGTAKGRLGERQLERLESFLADEKFECVHKIIMLHHDPIGSIKHYSGFDIPYGNVLTDADDFLSAIKKQTGKSGGNDMTVIFGHTHNHSHALDDISGANFLRVPSIGSIYGEDYLYLELGAAGEIENLKPGLSSDSEEIITRKLRNVWKTLFPDKFE